mgnify:CR=1 FL=1
MSHEHCTPSRADICGRVERDDLQRRVAERLRRVRVADVLDGLPDDLVVVERRVCRDLAGEDDRIALAEGFTRDPALRVLLEARVENRIRDVVTHLVRMSFRH